MGSHIEMKNASVMSQHQKDVKHLATNGRHGKEIDGESAGINRSEVGDERALRERSNEPLGPEFGVVVVARQPTKHKTGV
jgi:hypothetical protein